MESQEGEPDPSGMSPSELEELQRKNCVFCHISAGKVPARKVYEDNECIAVLDINPATPGHMLLMPKEHYTVMFHVPEQVTGRIFVIAKGLSQAGLKAFQSKGTTIFAANGVAAGQRAPHFMLHIIPRSQGDNAGLYIPSRALGAKEAEQIATALSATLGYRRQPSTHSEEKKEGAEAATEAATTEARESRKEEGNVKHAADKTASAKQIGASPIAHSIGKADAHRQRNCLCSAHRGIEPMRSGGFAASEPSDLDSITDFLAGSKTSKVSKGGGGRP